MEWSFSLASIHETARLFWESSVCSKVIAFHGEMGSGKTTFIHALCDVKNVKDTVGSPTFSIINEYIFEENEKEKKIFHIDLYRLKDEEEARQAGIEDCFLSGHTCLVEWPEKAGSLLPDDTLHIYIEIVDPRTRHLKIADK